jgi:hypothetical protein
MPILKESIITPAEGETLALHVFAPGIKYRIRNPESLLPPCVLRWSSVGYHGFKLYEKIELLGPSVLVTLNAAFSGTSGRAQVPILTEHPLKVWSYLDNPPMIDTLSSDVILNVLKEILARYDMSEHYENRRKLDERIKHINRETGKRERPAKAKRP